MYYFICGEDTYRSRKKLKELVKNFVSSSAHDGIFTLDASLEYIESALEKHLLGQNLFGAMPPVCIRYPLSGLPENRDWLLKNFSRLAEFSAPFVLWDAALFSPAEKKSKKSRAKNGTEAFFECARYAKKIFEYPLLTNSALESFIRRMAEEKNIPISPADAKGLAEASLGDLWMVEHELEKYLLTGSFGYRGSAPIIQKLYDFTDAVMTGNTARAVELLERVRESGFEDPYIVATLAGVLRNMLKVKSVLPLSPDYRKLKEFGMHEFVLKKTLSHVRRFRLNDLKRLYRLIGDLDVALKTSQADPGALFTRLIAACA